VNYSWIRAGQRQAIPYENPERRRVNVLAVLQEDGPAPSLWWDRVPRPLTSQDLLTLLPAIPKPSGRLVVVLDNGSIHVSRTVKAALPALKAQGIELYYLPPYSPELNAIERVFGGIKHHGLPARRYPSVPDLIGAVDQAFTEAEARLLTRHQCLHQLSPAG
jgi:hypothetical protein